MEISTEELEQTIARDAGVYVAAQVSGDEIELSGMASTEGEHQAAIDVARDFLSDRWKVVDNIEVTSVLPEEMEGMELSTADAGDFPSATPETEDNESLEAGDFMDQRILENAEGAAGPTAITDIDQDYSEGEETYVPPTDPPSDGADEVIGGFQTTSMDPEDISEGAIPSGLISGSPDEAIRDSVLHELREDSETTALEIEVEVSGGIVHLGGVVDDILDAEAAEAVAARVDGVREVQEHLTLRSG
jgi:osmotically-inducible protein OsmY